MRNNKPFFHSIYSLFISKIKIQTLQKLIHSFLTLLYDTFKKNIVKERIFHLFTRLLGMFV
jgi:hypothetical protein